MKRGCCTSTTRHNNTAQAQFQQREKYDEKVIQAKPHTVGQYVWVFQNVFSPKRTKNLLKKWRGPFEITTDMAYNRYGDKLLNAKIKPDENRADPFDIGELVPYQEWQIITDDELLSLEYHSVWSWK